MNALVSGTNLFIHFLLALITIVIEWSGFGRPHVPFFSVSSYRADKGIWERSVRKFQERIFMFFFIRNVFLFKGKKFFYEFIFRAEE